MLLLPQVAIYRVIHKSVKHFKNSQQIDYATDHGNSYVDRERNCLSFFKEKPAQIVALICRQETVVANMAFNIGRTGQADDALMRWPPLSPDLTPYDFFLWGFVRDTVFVPPLPANLQDLRNLITAAVALVDRDMLTRVWNEMDYRIDVCRITKGI